MEKGNIQTPLHTCNSLQLHSLVLLFTSHWPSYPPKLYPIYSEPHLVLNLFFIRPVPRHFRPSSSSLKLQRNVYLQMYYLFRSSSTPPPYNKMIQQHTSVYMFLERTPNPTLFYLSTVTKMWLDYFPSKVMDLFFRWEDETHSNWQKKKKRQRAEILWT